MKYDELNRAKTSIEMHKNTEHTKRFPLIRALRAIRRIKRKEQ